MVYLYLQNFQTNGGSIPRNIVVTSSRPDLVIVDSSKSPKTVYLYELTVCFEWPGNMESANNRKYICYTQGLLLILRRMDLSAKIFHLKLVHVGIWPLTTDQNYLSFTNCVLQKLTFHHFVRTFVKLAYCACMLSISLEHNFLYQWYSNYGKYEPVYCIHT